MASNLRKIFGTICDGEIEICLLSEEYIEGAIEVLRNSFFLRENIVRATDICLPESGAAKDELEQFGRGMISDGISLVARHVETDTIVGVAINTLLYIPEPGKSTYIEQFSETCKTPNMQTVMSFLAKTDEEYDIFKNWKIDSIFEIMFLSTLPEFEKKRIGRTLCKYSIEFAEELNQGIGTEYLPEGLQNKTPKAVAALFSSKFSQRIGEVLGFQVLKEISYENFSYDGKTFAEKIGPLHPFYTISALRL